MQRMGSCMHFLHLWGPCLSSLTSAGQATKWVLFKKWWLMQRSCCSQHNRKQGKGNFRCDAVPSSPSYRDFQVFLGARAMSQYHPSLQSSSILLPLLRFGSLRYCSKLCHHAGYHCLVFSSSHLLYHLSQGLASHSSSVKSVASKTFLLQQRHVYYLQLVHATSKSNSYDLQLTKSKAFAIRLFAERSYHPLL